MGQHAYLKEGNNVFNLWGIKHATGIPHSSIGQSIIKRGHRSLRDNLEKQKGLCIFLILKNYFKILKL